MTIQTMTTRVYRIEDSLEIDLALGEIAVVLGPNEAKLLLDGLTCALNTAGGISQDSWAVMEHMELYIARKLRGLKN